MCDSISCSIGAWYIELERDKKMKLVRTLETRVPMYRQEPVDNYQKVKALKIGGKNGKR